MKSAAVVALALLESANAFQAPALKAARSVSKVSMFSEGDIGVLPRRRSSKRAVALGGEKWGRYACVTFQGP